MRLMYCVPFFPSLYTPWLFREMAWMRQRGHDVAVLSLGPAPGPVADIGEYGLAQVPILHVRLQYESDRQLAWQMMALLAGGCCAEADDSLRSMRAQLGLRQGLQTWAVSKRVAAFVRQFRPDIIEAHWAAHPASLARQIKLKQGVPYAIRMHGGSIYRTPSPQLPQMVADADAVCPVSAFLVELLRGHRPVASYPIVPPVTLDDRKLRICPNGIPAPSMAAEPVAQRDDVVVVGSTGRVESVKRHGDLVTAVSALKDRHRGLRLKIIGGGELEPALRQHAASVGIADRVEITGPLHWQKVIEHVRQLHIYAQVSSAEGCALAVAEALGQGLPAVLTRVGSAAESIDEGVNGYTIDVGDTAALSDRIDRLIVAGAARRRQMGESSLRIARERFDFGTLMTRVEAILTAAARGHELPA